LLSLLFALAGCSTLERHKVVKPKQEELYNLPPETDAKWDRPLEYPKGTLNQDTIKKKNEQDKDAAKPGGGGPGGGGGPHMGMNGGGGY
jgi:hypothetical protein